MRNVKLKMTKAQVSRFIRRVVKNKDVEFDIKFFTDKSEWAYGGWIAVTKNNKMFCLSINRHITTDIRCLLLHEIGHVEGKDNHNRSGVKRELSAQLWAIKRAKELGWNNLRKELTSSLKNNWGKYDWNSGYRKYILANKLAKKEGII